MKTIRIVGLLLWAALGNAAWAQPQEASELISQLQRNASPPDEAAKFSMQLIESDGKVSHRTGVFYQKQKVADSLEDLKLVRFYSPPEMKGSGVLTIENIKRADDQWLYLPAYHTSRKIPSSNRSDRYMGTDFFYEDISDAKIEQYRFSYAGKETIDGRQYLKVEQVPTADEVKRESAYGRKVLWVDPERLVDVRVEYFDKDGQLVKRFDARKPVQFSGRWRWEEVQMVDLRSNHKTLIFYTHRTLSQGLMDSLFTVRSLERGQ